MKEGKIIFTSDEARKEYEKVVMPKQKRNDCPSCEVKLEDANFVDNKKTGDKK